MIPHFLVIGAQKSGTTWLDRNLRNNPNIWLAPEKEIHYFDLPKNIPFLLFIFAPERGDRYWVLSRIKRAIKAVNNKPHLRNWYLRYYCLPRTDRWYRSLFNPDKQQLVGDITPHYAIMSDDKIAHLQALAPEMKLIYVLRNPIERMWSQAAMQFSERSGYQGIDTIDEEKIIKFLCKPKQLAHSRYFKNLQRWEQYFPTEQIFPVFFDDIAGRPNMLLKTIFRFLGLKIPADYAFKQSRKKVFARDYPEMPPAIGARLAELLIDDIEQLHQRFNNAYTAQWLAAAHSYLAAAAHKSAP